MARQCGSVEAFEVVPARLKRGVRQRGQGSFVTYKIYAPHIQSHACKASLPMNPKENVPDDNKR
ncbi:hypothetical protein HYALB_00011802 [Hymenoscyphus albidus]|uniref:Uncharacterized protein n=1 Tax=Hymenoscyphus albidus TaxID=595503 RepID=A0A9N9LT92_9HELO|nr:hypothetical protein HYALB_00011802 [Hymenoscyphus albidus]